MKFKRSVLLISILCLAMFLTGCGEALYTMTAEEEQIITLYAAKQVSKYNKNQTTGIANARIKPGELDEVSAPVVKDEPVVAPEVSIDPETGEITTNDMPPSNVAPTDEGYSFTEAVGIEGIDFTCYNFDVSTEYKPSSSFILSEVKGKKYVVLSIEGTNNSDSAVDFSSFAKQKYSLSINGANATERLFTPLTNDLSTFSGTIKPGETKNFILVFSFSNSETENITSLELYVDGNGSTRATTI